MTKLRSLRLPNTVLMPGWKGVVCENLFRLSKVACIFFLCCAATVIASSAQTFTALASLETTNGSAPQGYLIQGTDGNFYGTAVYDGSHGDGTVFRITPEGAPTTLYSFCAEANCTDGEYPSAGLVQANGDFYGTTSDGGAKGAGTVFKITLAGDLTAIYSFCSQANCSDGEYPAAGLVEGTDGDFYGTTSNGGAFGGGCGSYGCGTVFKITPAGRLTTLYTFCSQPNPNCTDDEVPTARLVQSADGNFYGTTAFSGNAETCPNDCGTVF